MEGGNSNGSSKKSEQVPERIEELLKKEKRKDISKEEREELFSFLTSVDDVKNLVMSEPFNFTERDYNRMMRSKVEHGARQKAGKALKDPAEALRGKESEDFDDFLTNYWSQARDIGTTVVQKYTSRASELGYYDEDMDMVDMRGFTEDSIEFYIHEAPKVEQYEQTIKAWQVAFQTAKMMINRQRESIRKLAMFVMDLSKKHDVPVEELAPVRGILNQVVGGENLAR